MPARVPVHVRSARAAELLLQQPQTDRSDARHGDDPQRDGPRRARHSASDGRARAAERPPAGMGDSVGHWEGDTLVVDTTNFTKKTQFRGSSDQLHVDRALHAHRSERRCSTASRSRIRRRGIRRGLASIRGSRPTRGCMRVCLATKATTCSPTCSAARAKEAEDAREK